jgi:hypothetical protein
MGALGAGKSTVGNILCLQNSEENTMGKLNSFPIVSGDKQYDRYSIKVQI